MIRASALRADPEVCRWYALRVSSRRPAIGSCPRLVSPVATMRADPSRAPIGGVPDRMHEPLCGELVAAHALERRGVEVWVPRAVAWNRANRFHRKAKKLVARPILPGYVLARLAGPVNWYEVLSVPMVRGVMGFGDAPTPLPEAGIARLEDIERRLWDPAGARAMPTGRAYSVGSEVEVLDGPLTGARVRVVSLAGETARIFARFFGEELEVSIGVEKLGAVA